MKYIITSLILLTFFSTNAQTDSLLQNIVVIKNGSTLEVQVEPIKKIKFTTELSLHLCTYPHMIKYLKKEAVRYNANVVKIVKLKYPDMWTSCYRSTALLYKVAEPTYYIEETVWVKDKKLVWEDFKYSKTHKNSEGINANNRCVFTMKMAPGITPLNPMKYEIKAIFLNHQSWVTNNVDERDDTLLQYQQLQFDLCEVYTRLLYKKLLSAKLLFQNKEPAYHLKKRIEVQYKERIEALNKETDFGRNNVVLQEWSQQIENELTELSNYEDHYF